MIFTRGLAMILSTIAARESYFWRKPIYQSVHCFVAYYTARQSGTAKSPGILYRRLAWAIFAHGDSTPQAFIQTLLSRNRHQSRYPQQTIDELKERLLFAGQRGWLFDNLAGRFRQ